MAMSMFGEFAEVARQPLWSWRPRMRVMSVPWDGEPADCGLTVIAARGRGGPILVARVGSYDSEIKICTSTELEMSGPDLTDGATRGAVRELLEDVYRKSVGAYLPVTEEQVITDGNLRWLVYQGERLIGQAPKRADAWAVACLAVLAEPKS